MKIELSASEKEALEKQHKVERDKRIADRIKAVLLSAEGWSQRDIAQVLRIHRETVHQHLLDYCVAKKLNIASGGSDSYLNADQTKALIEHLDENTYLKVEEIVRYVRQEFHIVYRISGMTKWLKNNGFSYKKPKGTPAKADPEAQKNFIEFYQELVAKTPEDEPIEFGDGVHPTMATKISYGWIRKGKDKRIETTASRTRLNLFGSINLACMEITIANYETIDSKAMRLHFQKLREKYPSARKIHLIVDCGPYNKSNETKEAALEFGIVLHFLPPYSPNLNPIERVWKLANELTRNNRVFASTKEFKNSILGFFTETWPKIAYSMIDRITDNFQIIAK